MQLAVRPLTPALSPEYGGEGGACDETPGRPPPLPDGVSRCSVSEQCANNQIESCRWPRYDFLRPDRPLRSCCAQPVATALAELFGNSMDQRSHGAAFRNEATEMCGAERSHRDAGWRNEATAVRDSETKPRRRVTTRDASTKPIRGRPPQCETKPRLASPARKVGDERSHFVMEGLIPEGVMWRIGTRDEILQLAPNEATRAAWVGETPITSPAAPSPAPPSPAVPSPAPSGAAASHPGGRSW
jgi:hypothetical protein